MGIPDSLIKEAVARYARERDRYLKLAMRVADLCRTAIVEDNAIRAQITSRTKTVKSFEGKLRRFSRRPDKQFQSVDQIFEQIGDFAGVRVATYRPEDEARVAEAVAKLFSGAAEKPVEIDRKDKLNPEAGLFYRATHCQVFLPDSDLVGDYDNLRGASCEIQICSMMAHVWNEIEHDIGYKPEGGGPSDAERGLLETLGHLARAGDAAITRLLAANIARMEEQTGDFADVHDFVARLRPHFPAADLSVNAGMAYDEAQSLGLNSMERIRAATTDDILNLETAQSRIDRFNAFLVKEGRMEASLNPVSADLFTIGLLHAFSDEIAANHLSGEGKSRSTRMFEVSSAYVEFKEAIAGSAEAA